MLIFTLEGIVCSGGFRIHNPKVGGSIPPPLPMFSTTYGEPTACHFRLSRSCHVKFSSLDFHVWLWSLRLRLLLPLTACIFRRMRVTHRHPNVRPSKDSWQRESSRGAKCGPKARFYIRIPRRVRALRLQGCIEVNVVPNDKGVNCFNHRLNFVIAEMFIECGKRPCDYFIPGEYS
jgi:hypothetical protein